MDQAAEHPAQTDAPAGLLRRIIAFPLILLVLGVTLVGMPGLLLANTVAETLKDAAPALLLPWAFLAVSVTWLLYRGFKRWIEREPDAELRFGAGWARETLIGVLAGAALFSACVGLVALLGGLRVTGLGSGASLPAVAAMALTAAINEEVLFRAIGFRFAERLGGSLFALAVTSLLFGILHLFNPGATLFAALAIASEAGIMLGAAYMLTRRLWLAVGLHAGWNFTQGWIWTIPVSGQAEAAGLFLTERQGPGWLTGGAFGLEASAVTLAVATLVGLAMTVLAVRRGQWVPLGWLPGRP
ncbi:CPBP family intramembrane metalloprotease [Paracraurococcus ruber]|uniref:CPBP family intramembrane glutamic endopeptidase n=1 Tax=Paracraurococcus ruber TaxID=77675 RepID=UPI001057DD3F|nr:type II CAAX endopeptidase family protein [Paracraurococcus ruber]TDG28827.1 CPBP family intramembrane metalloprotease [Paracraurococcus ruber]